MEYAPIILFVYNRPDHTQQTLSALTANHLAKESNLIIYSDAPKNLQAEESVKAVRSLIKNIQGFKSVTIIERDKNWGLANSIIDGVTDVVNKYGKVIVLEDDIVTSPYFLLFINKALDFYENEKKVWHISGWNYPIFTSDLPDAFFWRTMNCWGWSTWKDRWQYYEKNVDKLIDIFSEDDIYLFDINDTAEMWSQVISNKEGKINTWAIFWYATIFKNEGLCLNPAVSFVKNIGLDGSGIHCGIDPRQETKIINNKEIDFNAIPIQENKKAFEEIIKYQNMKKEQEILQQIGERLGRIEAQVDEHVSRIEAHLQQQAAQLDTLNQQLNALRWDMKHPLRWFFRKLRAKLTHKDSL